MSITITRPDSKSALADRTFYVNLNGSGIEAAALIEKLDGRTWVESVQRKRGRRNGSDTNSVRVVTTGMTWNRAWYYLNRLVDSLVKQHANNNVDDAPALDVNTTVATEASNLPRMAIKRAVPVRAAESDIVSSEQDEKEAGTSLLGGPNLDVIAEQVSAQRDPGARKVAVASASRSSGSPLVTAQGLLTTAIGCAADVKTHFSFDFSITMPDGVKLEAAFSNM